MAEGTATGRGAGRWLRIWNDTVEPWLAEPYVGNYVLPVAFSVITFVVYWYVGPQGTAFDNHVNQANSLLHGHLDLVPEYSGFITEPALKDGKMYLQHGLGPALMLLPAVALFGREGVNQTFVSVLLGAATAPLVYWIVRTQTKDVVTQIWLVAMFMFGTIFWYTAANGGVWFLSHTSAVFFLFLGVYATIVMKNPLVAGLALGAAYLSRQTALMALPFFVIMFSDLWLADAPEEPLMRRLRLEPLLRLGGGLGLFLAVSFVLNYMRFDNPFESGYAYSEQIRYQEHLAWLYNHGVLHISYIPRHIPVVFEGLPIFSRSAPYVLPSWAGMAIWATTPAFFLALFAGIKERWVIYAGASALGVMVAILVTRELGEALELGFGGWEIPLGIHLLPLWGMIGVAIYTGWRLRDKLILACWAAIIPIMIPIFLFAATGWTQFGYRYALDIYPFLLLLVVKAVGKELRWYHKGLIVASVLVNLWGVTWIYQFQEGGAFSPAGYLDLEWVRF